MVISKDAFDATPIEIHRTGSGLDSERNGGWRGLMEEIRITFDRGFFGFDVMEQGLDFFKPHGVRLTSQPGFLEITFEGLFLDLEQLQPPQQFLSGRLADFMDFLFEFLKLRIRDGDFFREHDGGFRILIHGDVGFW